MFVVGPQRAGTTWIYDLLAQQPHGVYIDRLEKENYFAFKHPSDSPQRLRRRYLDRIAGSGAPRLLADVCPVYLGYPDRLHSIMRAFPEAIFVAVRRDCHDRKRSFEAHRYVNNYGKLLLSPFGDPLYLSDSHYAAQSKQEQNIATLKGLVGDRLLLLDHVDLAADGGVVWQEELSRFSGFDLRGTKMDVVNQSRSHYGRTRRMSLAAVRVAQHFRLHIPARSVSARHFDSASSKGIR